ncbi:MAG: GAF and ANTAR domain-containing protein [Mycobacterium sp.]
MLRRTHNEVTLELARLLCDVHDQHVEDSVAGLSELTEAAVRSVPGAEYAGVTLAGRDGSIETHAPTDHLATDLDDIQRRQGEGPCLSAMFERQTIRVDDVLVDRRWPRFSHEVGSGLLVRSSLSIPLIADKRAVGALTLFAHAAGAFDDVSVEIGQILAMHIALAWTMLQRDRQFRGALATRDIIGQAKGILMERFAVDAVEAFELLKRMSQNTNLPLAQLAEQLVRSERPSP